MNRAWSTFEIKSFDDEQRTFEGIASTPSTDRMGDIVEPRGAKYKLPITMMWQHGKGAIKDPIGWITAVKVSDKQITVKGEFAKPKSDYPQSLTDELNSVWVKVRDKIVRGLSIGFNPIESEPIKNSLSERYTSWEWLELSPVAIPANQDSSILTVKSLDTELLAALGNQRSGVVRLTTPATDATFIEQRRWTAENLPGVSGPTKAKGRPVKKTIVEQISEFEAKRAAHEARMSEIMSKSAEESRTLEVNEEEEYDGLVADVKSIDAHLVRLRAHEKQLVFTAKPVTQENTSDADKAGETRGGRVITVRSMQPKGIGVARMAIATAAGALSYQSPVDIARRRWPDSPEVELALKAVVEAGDTTTSGWASQLIPAAQQMNEEFLELLRPETIIGKIPGLQRVPFNIAVPIETASGTARWVGEGAPKPVTKLTLDSVTLRWAKAAAIVAITEELARFSRPDAEMTVRNSMIKTLVRFFDSHFVSTTAAVSNVSPAGILNGISSTAVTGATAAAFRTDIARLLAKMTVNNVPLSSVVLLMSSTNAVNLSLMVTDLGVSLFQTITREGGTVLGFPVVVSEAVGTNIIAIAADNIFLASDPGVQVATSREATIEMDSAPAGGETSPVTDISVMKSAFQNNLIFIKFEQYITWVRARTVAVEYLASTAYTA